MPNRKGSNKKKGKAGISLEDEEQPTSLRYNAVHPTCVIAEEDLSELAVVGQGFYATVTVGHWTRPDKKRENVAIKCIKAEVVRDHLAEILTEANNMVKLEHDSIIKLYGICLVTRENEQCKVKLVTEYAPFGSLITVIQDKNEEHHSFFCQITKLWEFACQIAKGMEYLHSKNLIHFDLAARNVLVVAPNKVRITDFGLARVLCNDQKKILLEKPMAIAWCAPELCQNQLATKGCDIWSYGVLLWEMLSFGDQPWKDLSNEQIMEQVKNPDERLSQPQACSDAIFEIMQESWKQEPLDRPNFTKIIDSLKKAKPVVASAKNTFWTARPKELNFQKGTKITLIDRYGTDKHLCQNDKAEVGYVSEEKISLKVAPVEMILSKPKIGVPFDLRHTNKEAIEKEHNATGKFPVNVESLVKLATKNPPQVNISAEPKPCSSQVKTVPTSERGGQLLYTPMDGTTQKVDDNTLQKVKHDPSKRNSAPPPIPNRNDLSNQPPSSHSSTLKAKKKPVPKPRKNRPKSTAVEAQDSKLEWVIAIDSNKDDKKESETGSSVKSGEGEREGEEERAGEGVGKGEESFLPRYEEDVKDKTSTGCDAKDHRPELEMHENKQSAQTEPHSKKSNDVESSNLFDLISFDQKNNLPQAERKQEDRKPPPLPKRDIKSQGVYKVPFPSLPSPPVETPEPLNETPANQWGIKEGILINLEINQNEDNQKGQATSEEVPPPLPKKDFLSRRSRDLELIPPPVPKSSVPGTSVPNISQFPPKSSPIPIVQRDRSVESTGSFVSNSPIDFSTLTHPSSYRNEHVSSYERPSYSKPFPTTLPKLPKRELSLDKNTSTKPILKNESSVEKETGYGDEINDGIEKIHSQFPEISKDACYARILEYKGDIDQILKVLQVCTLTGMQEKEAQFHLGHCGWNVERTVNWILDKS